MVPLRGLAFLLGAAGLALFLAGILWAVLAPAHASCVDFPAGLECRDPYAALLAKVMWVIGAGLVLEAAAVVLLMLHLARGRPPPRVQPPPPRAPAPPTSRYLEPPVRPRAPAAGRGGKSP